jgi:D-amino peptidase
MKIYIMTDMEGVCGITSFHDWVEKGATQYAEGQKLLTMEVNAAIEGFFAAGATEIVVADGHGAGGINTTMLDKRASYVNKFPGPYPFMLDSSFGAVAWVGQHAKAGSEYAHMPHTGWFDVLDYQINGRSVGEFGQIALCAAFLGVRSVFCSGDEAMEQEAHQLISGIETAAVKRGLTPGSGDGCTLEEYQERNLDATHLDTTEARRLIRQKSEEALLRFMKNKDSFELLQLNPPYTRVIRYRGSNGKPGYTVMSEDQNSLIAMMNAETIIIE